jgi:adenosylcobinamide-GDP ribazoletransferase
MSTPEYFSRGCRALIVALLFLTRLPMPTLSAITPPDQGRAAACFPLVGLILGTLLVLAALLLAPLLPATVVAALLVLLWALLSGGLHLDGLADSADGWLAGGDRARTLEIMRDPRCGSAGVIAVCSLLLLKFACLGALLGQQQWLPLLLAPVLGRSATLLVILAIPYARPGGIATEMIAHAPRRTLPAALAASALMALLVLGPGGALLLATALLLLGWRLRRLMLARLGGATGDTAGACCEIAEVTSLIIACAVLL